MPRPSTRSRAGGFTLIELIIVVAIVALVGTVVIPSVEAAIGVRTRDEAGKLAGAIRAMYGEAVLSGRTCRLVFDIDGKAWWPECAEGKAQIREKEESVRGARVEEDAKDLPGTVEEDEERRRVDERNTFSAYEAALAPKRGLPDGVGFAKVWTQHQEEPYVAGKAYLYFFPHGQTERAYVYVDDGEGGSIYTLVVNPMTGRTKVIADDVPIPDERRR